MKRKLQIERDRLLSVADDAALDEDMRRVGRRAVALEQRILEMRRTLQEQVTLPDHKYFKDPTPAAITSSSNNNCDNDDRRNFNSRVVAATKIQVLVRGYFARRLVSMIMLDRVIRVWKPEIMKDFYFDRVSGLSTWHPPKLIMSAYLSRMTYMKTPVDEGAHRRRWSCKAIVQSGYFRQEKDRIGHHTNKKKKVAAILSGFCRCIIARKVAISKLNTIYRRVWDADSKSFFYANTRTGESSWTKPVIYLSVEPPMLSMDSNSTDSSSDGSHNHTGIYTNSPRAHRSPRHDPFLKRIS
eukprot:gene26930-35627_t